MSELALKQTNLQQVLDRVAGLVRTLKQTEDQKASLEAQANTAKTQLVRVRVRVGLKDSHCGYDCV
jgi:hypothetical protein